MFVNSFFEFYSIFDLFLNFINGAEIGRFKESSIAYQLYLNHAIVLFCDDKAFG